MAIFQCAFGCKKQCMLYITSSSSREKSKMEVSDEFSRLLASVTFSKEANDYRLELNCV